MELISRTEVPTEVGKKLYDILIASWKHGDFVYSVLSRLKGDEKKQKLIDFLEKNNIKDSDSIIDASFYISDGVEPEFED